MNVVIMFASQLTVYMNFFNMDMSFIKQMYSIDGRDQASETGFRADPKALVQERLKNRKPFLWSYKGFLGAKFILCFCCCFKKRECY